MRTLLLIPLLLAAGCAASPAEQARAQSAEAARARTLATRLAGLTPGQPVDCLDDFRVYSTEAIGGTILYKAGRDLVYRTDTGGGCEAMERGDILVTVSNFGRLCRGDIGRTVMPTTRSPTGSCALGSFTPYRRN